MCTSIMVSQGLREKKRKTNIFFVQILVTMILRIYQNCNNKEQIVGTKSNTFKCPNREFLSLNTKNN